MFGYFDWMSKLHNTYKIFDNYVLVIQSPYIANIPELTYKGDTTHPLKYPPVIPISPHFINGKWLNDTDIPVLEQYSWYLKVTTQTTATNNIVECGPFIPKPNKEFSWCVQMNYTAYFKWGGTVINLQNIQDPAKQDSYPVPSDQLDRIQIKNPGDKFSTEFHHWDYRRGLLTKKLLKECTKTQQMSHYVQQIQKNLLAKETN